MSIKNLIAKAIDTRADGSFYRRESQTLEFKTSFNLAAIASYMKDMAAFANNKGGLLVFGVEDTPRRAVGLNVNSIERFRNIDPEKISGFLNEYFSGHIEWDYDTFTVGSKVFAAFHIAKASIKPVVCKRDASKDLKNGAVYFRYGGRSQTICYPELEAIINERIALNNADWLNLVQKVQISGPSNVGIMDLKEKTFSTSSGNTVFVDAGVVSDLKVVPEGKVDPASEEAVFRLVGDVVPVSTFEIEKEVLRDHLSEYTLSATRLASEVRKLEPKCTKHRTWKIIAREGIKTDPKYASYSFTNPDHYQEFKKSGKARSSATSIYKPAAINRVVEAFRAKPE